MSNLAEFMETIRNRQSKVLADKERLHEVSYLMGWLENDKAEALLRVGSSYRDVKVGRRLRERIRVAVMEDIEHILESIEQEAP